MKVFICWSKRRSEVVAKALYSLLQSTLKERVEVFGSWDIKPGTSWPDKIRDNLGEARAVVVCLTPENLSEPWIHYEAGAIGGANRDRILPLLHEVEQTDLSGPLAQSQATTTSEVEKLIRRLAELAKEPGDWERRFAKKVQVFTSALEKLGRPLPGDRIEDLERGFERKTFLEPIHKCTRQSWTDRHAGAHETWKRLEERRADIRRHCEEHVADMFDDLVAELDGYAMDMSGLLLSESRFELDEDGSLRMPGGVRTTCEGRRLRIWRLLRQCQSPPERPMTQQAGLFRKLDSFEDRKMLVHAIEARINDGETPEGVDELGRSWWDLDRIVHHLVREREGKAKHYHVRMEVEKARLQDPPETLMPLHYSVRALLTTLRRTRPIEKAAKPEVVELLELLGKYLKGLKAKNEPIVENLNAILEHLGEPQLQIACESAGPDGRGATTRRTVRKILTAALLFSIGLLALQALSYGVGFALDPASAVKEFGYEKPTVVDNLTVTLVGLVGVGLLGTAALLALSAILVWRARPAGIYIAMVTGGVYVLAGIRAYRAEWWWDAGFYSAAGALLIGLAAAVRWCQSTKSAEEPD